MKVYSINISLSGSVEAPNKKKAMEEFMAKVAKEKIKPVALIAIIGTTSNKK
jgi:hypothetical protein